MDIYHRAIIFVPLILKNCDYFSAQNWYYKREKKKSISIVLTTNYFWRKRTKKTGGYNTAPYSRVCLCISVRVVKVWLITGIVNLSKQFNETFQGIFMDQPLSIHSMKLQLLLLPAYTCYYYWLSILLPDWSCVHCIEALNDDLSTIIFSGGKISRSSGCLNYCALPVCRPNFRIVIETIQGRGRFLINLRKYSCSSAFNPIFLRKNFGYHSKALNVIVHEPVRNVISSPLKLPKFKLLKLSFLLGSFLSI